ncbi:hypothetical protein [Arthrobacter alpinus]|uniref:hypothetical protein n=1 Tax=Arthrobacter alpinus TaxID=656366 RepID=UPI001644AF25|nr:hypothetical protein [Arthrobacter alpinus]
MNAWQAWESALDQLQCDAHHAIEQATSRTFADATGGAQLAWTPPESLGQLPAGLAAQATALLVLQERAATLIAASRDDVEQEIHALTVKRTPVRSVYVDVTG